MKRCQSLPRAVVHVVARTLLNIVHVVIIEVKRTRADADIYTRHSVRLKCHFIFWWGWVTRCWWIAQGTIFGSVMSFNEKAHCDFQYERREESAVWQIDVCSQGGPLHYMYRIDVAGGGGVCVCVCVCVGLCLCVTTVRELSSLVNLKKKRFEEWICPSYNVLHRYMFINPFIDYLKWTLYNFTSRLVRFSLFQCQSR